MSIISDNIALMTEDDSAHVLSSSFQTQMAMALMAKNRLSVARSGGAGAGRGVGSGDDDKHGNDAADRLSKLVLSRINQMELNLADVAKDMRELRGSAGVSASGISSGDDSAVWKKADWRHHSPRSNNSPSSGRAHLRTKSHSALALAKTGTSARRAERVDAKGKGKEERRGDEEQEDVV